GVLAGLGQGRVLLLVLRPREQVGGDHRAVGVAGAADAADTAGAAEDDPGLAAAGRDEPQRGGGGVVLVAVRVGPCGGEVEVAVGGERRAGLALAATGQPVRLLPTG